MEGEQVVTQQQQQQQQQQQHTPARKRSVSNLDVLFQGVDLVAPNMSNNKASLLAKNTLDSQSSPVMSSKKQVNSASEVKGYWRDSRDSWSTEEGADE